MEGGIRKMSPGSDTLQTLFARCSTRWEKKKNRRKKNRGRRVQKKWNFISILAPFLQFEKCWMMIRALTRSECTVHTRFQCILECILSHQNELLSSRKLFIERKGIWGHFHGCIQTQLLFKFLFFFLVLFESRFFQKILRMYAEQRRFPFPLSQN